MIWGTVVTFVASCHEAVLSLGQPNPRHKTLPNSPNSALLWVVAPFPEDCATLGRRIEYLSKVLLPAGRYAEYLALMGEILAPTIHYIDSVHEYRTRSEVLGMLGRYLPRVANGGFQFELLHDGGESLIWRWVIVLKIRFTPFQFTINGLVHARIAGGRIVYQREYYDPMESISVIPFVGWLYKLVLRLG
ncbi:MAG: nuclear transport factor 2 family protein [Deltaproteobacteria bacterium]|nr:nuclear transport factor 2 family protein [Deltaproteobacteria bacterium]MBI3294785.1 nuclear transport factor 2 family protein [Deltaproteobacteria bacterium]